jgi:DNA-binding beta-propeller fold protein YncE
MRTNPSTLFLTICSALFFAQSCSHSPTTPDQSEQISFAGQIQPIFNRHCAFSGCHVSGSTPSGLVLTSYADLAKGGLEGNAIIPFEPALSHLFQHINGDSTLSPQAEPPMPFMGARIPTADILTIHKWIQQGAPDDASEPMYSNLSKEQFIITNQSDDFITLFSAESGLISRLVPLFTPTWPFPHQPPRAPHYVRMAPDGRTAYASLIAAGLLIKIDLPSRRIVQELPLGGSPAHIEITSDGRKAVVSNFSTRNEIHVIDLFNFSEERKIGNVFYNPHGMVLLPDDRTLFTAGSVSDLLYRIDILTGAAQIFKLSPLTPDGGELSPKLSPYQIRFNPNDNNLYVSCRNRKEVRVWSIATQTVIDSVGVGERPLLMDFNKTYGELWVACQGDSSLHIIDVAGRHVKRILSDLPNQPHGVKFSESGATVGVTCENVTGDSDHHHPGTRSGSPGVFLLIDAATKQILSEREVGGFAAGIDIIP